MKIIEPSVELWQQELDWKAHVAKCARVCYASERTDRNDKMVENLMTKGHWSMFRHYSVYLIVPTKAITNILKEHLKCPYVEYAIDKGCFYIATNGQYWFETLYANYPFLNCYIINALQFAETEIGFKLLRYTFKVTTQISTSRELNRVSPNNIAERSTRYVYEDGTLCKPHWLTSEIEDFGNDTYLCKKANGNYDDNAQLYLESCASQFRNYKKLVVRGMHRQDARGLLPLDTATVCIYTYSITEWRHILDLRYYGTTGVPHPNAKIIAEQIRKLLIEKGNGFRD